MIDLSAITNFFKTINYKLIITTFVLVCTFLFPIIILDSLGSILHISHKISQGVSNVPFVEILMYVLKVALFLVAGFMFMHRAQSLRIVNLILYTSLIPLIVKLQFIAELEIRTYILTKPNFLSSLAKIKQDPKFQEYFFSNLDENRLTITLTYISLFLVAAIFAMITSRDKTKAVE